MVLLVYGEALLASQTLGHWPIPSLNDPKDLTTAPLHFVGFIVILAVIPGTMLVLWVSAMYWRQTVRSNGLWVYVVLSVASWALLSWVNGADDRTWAWWFD